MITSAKEMGDNIKIKQSILTFGIGELEIWKRSVIADEDLFNQLFDLIFSDEHRLAWRSVGFLNRAGKLLQQLRS